MKLKWSASVPGRHYGGAPQLVPMNMKRILGGLTSSSELESGGSDVAARDAMIVGIACLADARDDASGGHIERMMRYAELLGTAIRGRARRALFSSQEVHWLKLSAALHDIGKAAISDSILLKPGILTDAERLIMQEHTIIGARCLDQVLSLHGPDEMITMARQVIRSHHERWDGGGYPDHLADADIPLAARIIALCDVYDALTRRKVYKLAMSHEQAHRIIRDGAGTQFDPAVVRAFEAVEQDFQSISLTVEGHEEMLAEEGINSGNPRFGPGFPAESDDDDPPTPPRVA